MEKLLTTAEALDAAPGRIEDAEGAVFGAIITALTTTDITTGVTIGAVIPEASQIVASTPRGGHVDNLLEARGRALS